MAVQAPVAPTPPTPPSVPGVTLQDGGTVRDSNVPQNIKQSNDERLESQARQSVAQGDGGLSKTTTARPEKPAKPAKNQTVDASGGASQEGQTVIAPQQGAQALNQEAANKDLQTQTKAEAPPQDRGLDNGLAGHGAAFWGAALLLMAVVSWFGIKKIMSRRQGRRGLSWADLDGAARPVQVETYDELRGLTPDEVLKKMAADEKAQARQAAQQAREEARQRLEKAGRIPVQTAVPTAAAQQYREQIVAGAASADLPQARPKPVVKPRPVKQEEEQRFEVRI